MKQLSHSLFAFVLLALVSCNNDNPSPARRLIPDQFTEADLTKTFVYNDAGQLSQILSSSKLPGGGTITSHHDFVYDVNGQLSESSTDTGFRYVYFFTGDLITRTDEYVAGVRSQYHIHSYNNDKRLIERVTWQNIPEEGGEIPVAKDTYEYDQQGNITTQRLYYYTAFGAQAKLLTIFTFSDYDDKINTDDYFDFIAFNPLATFSKNNPGKLVIQNASGVVSVTETFSYHYHTDGYATNKTTSAVYYNGNSGSYESTYRFK